MGHRVSVSVCRTGREDRLTAAAARTLGLWAVILLCTRRAGRDPGTLRDGVPLMLARATLGEQVGSAVELLLDHS